MKVEENAGDLVVNLTAQIEKPSLTILLMIETDEALWKSPWWESFLVFNIIIKTRPRVELSFVSRQLSSILVDPRLFSITVGDCRLLSFTVV